MQQIDFLTDTELYRLKTWEEELNAKLQHSYEQSLAGQGRPYEEVFDELERRLS